MSDAITATSLSLKEVRRSLLGLVFQSKILSASGTSLKSHRLRSSIFTASEESSLCAFQPSSRPTDDRTIKSEHYDTLWDVFGLPGPALPSSTHIAIVNEIADYRNKLIHGRMPYKAFSKQKKAQDILDALTRIDEIILHVCTSVETYLSSAGYKR
jgi:hypothetical protein